MRWLTGLRAGILLARHQRSQAAALYRELLDVEPAHVPGLIAVLSDCVERHALGAAVEVATRALAVDPQHFMALQVLGWAYVTQGHHEAARPIVERARAEFDAQGLRDGSTMVAWVSLLSAADSGVDELTAWRRWADSYLAGAGGSSDGADAG